MCFNVSENIPSTLYCFGWPANVLVAQTFKILSKIDNIKAV